MKNKNIICPLCQIGKCSFLVMNPTNNTQLLKCLNCGIIFNKFIPRRFPKDIYNYYENIDTSDFNFLFNPLNEKRYISLIKSFEKLSDCHSEKILDVGCGIGHFVKTAKENGWDALGIDPSAEAVKIGQDEGININIGDLESKILRDSKFDVITMFEVIEHVIDPEKTLKKAYELLTNNGLLYLTTPNFKSLDKTLIGNTWSVIDPKHLFYFTPKTLDQLLIKTGFSKISLGTKHFRPELLPNFFKRKALSDTFDQNYRFKLENNLILRLMKDTANIALNVTKTGSSMTALYKKNY